MGSRIKYSEVLLALLNLSPSILGAAENEKQKNYITTMVWENSKASHQHQATLFPKLKTSEFLKFSEVS